MRTKALTRTALACAMALALAGCGGGGDDPQAQSNAPLASAVPVELAATPVPFVAVPTASATAAPRASPAAMPLAAVGPARIVFGGHTFEVRDGSGGPGPNTWSRDNVWVDRYGLHLKIAYRDGQWSCAEIYTTEPLGYGKYDFRVASHPELMDDNVVLGLFNYPTADVGPDGTNEIDIEFATWGGAQEQHGNWTVWPAEEGAGPTTFTFDPIPTHNVTPYVFNWSESGVQFTEGRPRFGRTGSPGKRGWRFQPANASTLVPQDPLPLHMNLWLFQGQPPTDGKEVEIVITKFKFTPLRKRR